MKWLINDNLNNKDNIKIVNILNILIFSSYNL